MFIGHFAVGLAAKKTISKPSLGTIFMAAQWIDLIWPIFILLGIEQVIVEPGITKVTPFNFLYYPFTHSLIGVLIWALLFGFVYYIFKRNLKTAAILGLLVLSHWMLDLLVHQPDLPLTISENSNKVGLGLWNSIAGTLLVELGFFIAGIVIYLQVTKAKVKKGIYLFWSLILFLFVVYIGNIFGEPPTDEKLIGYVGLSQWLIIGWAYWIDKNRVIRD